MSWNFEELTTTAVAEITRANNPQALEELRIKYLGSKGLIKEIYSTLTSLPQDERPLVGKNVNELRNTLTELIQEKKKNLETSAPTQTAHALDVTLPGVARPQGHEHILTQVIEDICSVFEGLGFAVQEGPEIETEFNNFAALNIPVDHPSRDAFDTFYLDLPDPKAAGRFQLLRSHTSPGQIRIMQKFPPPLAVVIPGKVYRPDAVDASHSFMFHQIEGLLVDKDVKFSDLKGLIDAFCKRFFGERVKTRFRPHFFPFTEPSAEVDITYDVGEGKKSSKEWLEIMGCGMVHPKVFESCGYPKGKYTGLAFGMGVERMAMVKYGINDIRIFFENDVRFLNQF